MANLKMHNKVVNGNTAWKVVISIEHTKIQESYIAIVHTGRVNYNSVFDIVNYNIKKYIAVITSW